MTTNRGSKSKCLPRADQHVNRSMAVVSLAELWGCGGAVGQFDGISDLTPLRAATDIDVRESGAI